jgi:enoyl-CoA hydratase/carnithine racemase
VTHLRESLDDGVLTLTLARPRRLNALNPALVRDLGEALERARRPEVRVVAILGEGTSFSSGADVDESLGLPDLAAAQDFLNALASVLRTIHLLPKPVIAGLRGHAAGGGAEIALEADLRIAATDAQLWFPDVGIGSTPASTWQLVQMVGKSRATRMVMLRERLGATEMAELGLVVEVVAPDELPGAVSALATRLCEEASPLSLGFAKQGIDLAVTADRESDLRHNVAAMLACHLSDDQRAAVERWRR